MKTFCRGVLIVLTLPVGAFAQDPGTPGEVCAVAKAHYAAIRSGDMATVVQQHLPDFTFFTNDGGLLWAFDSSDEQLSQFESDSTLSIQTSLRHCDARIFGDVAVATYYLDGAETHSGKTRSGVWRVTEVWVRRQDEWKEAHHHESPLLDSIESERSGEDGWDHGGRPGRKRQP